MYSQVGRLTTFLTLAISLAACERSDSLFVEHRETSTGELDGLQVGMDRQHALGTAKVLGASSINPITCDHFRISIDNVDELPSLAHLEGISIASRQGSTEAIFFAEGRVSEIVKSPFPKFSSGIEKGDNVDTARSKVLTVLRSRADITVQPLLGLDGNFVLPLEKLSAEDWHRFRSRDCWSFEITTAKPAGATYDLRFQDGKLSSISYRRARINTE